MRFLPAIPHTHTHTTHHAHSSFAPFIRGSLPSAFTHTYSTLPHTLLRFCCQLPVHYAHARTSTARIRLPTYTRFPLPHTQFFTFLLLFCCLPCLCTIHTHTHFFPPPFPHYLLFLPYLFAFYLFGLVLFAVCCFTAHVVYLHTTHTCTHTHHSSSYLTHAFAWIPWFFATLYACLALHYHTHRPYTMPACLPCLPHTYHTPLHTCTFFFTPHSSATFSSHYRRWILPHHLPRITHTHTHCSWFPMPACLPAVPTLTCLVPCLALPPHTPYLVCLWLVVVLQFTFTLPYYIHLVGFLPPYLHGFSYVYLWITLPSPVYHTQLRYGCYGC